MNMEKQELWLRITGSICAIIVSALVIYGVWFVAQSFNTALNPSLIKASPTVTFNLDKMKQLVGEK